MLYIIYTILCIHYVYIIYIYIFRDFIIDIIYSIGTSIYFVIHSYSYYLMVLCNILKQLMCYGQCEPH